MKLLKINNKDIEVVDIASALWDQLSIVLKNSSQEIYHRLIFGRVAVKALAKIFGCWDVFTHKQIRIKQAVVLL